MIKHLYHFVGYTMMESLPKISTVERDVDAYTSTHLKDLELLLLVHILDQCSQVLDLATFVVPQAYSQPSSYAHSLLLSTAPDMGLEDNLADSSSDQDYNLANGDNYDDGDEDDGVITHSNLALVMDTSSTFLYHVDAGCTDTFGPEEPATLNIQQELYKGMQFVDVLSLRRAVKLYAIRTHQTFQVILSKHGTEDQCF